MPPKASSSAKIVKTLEQKQKTIAHTSFKKGDNSGMLALKEIKNSGSSIKSPKKAKK